MFNKKKALILAAAAVAVALIASACSANALPKAITDNISEIRTNIYSSPDSANVINVITGTRENPYKIDGITGKIGQYTVITYTPAQVVPNMEYSYKLTAGDKEYSGKMEVHPMGTSVAAEFGTALTVAEISVVITPKGGSEQLYPLTGKYCGDEMIKWEDAVSAAMNTLKEPLAAMFDGKTLKGEVFIRLTNEPKSSDLIYWYVSFCDGDKTIAALIDARTGQVVASRTA